MGVASKRLVHVNVRAESGRAKVVVEVRSIVVQFFGIAFAAIDHAKKDVQIDWDV